MLVNNTTLDVHECENGQDNCNANAVCSNTPGAFDCYCRNGHFGDGEICISESYHIIECVHSYKSKSVTAKVVV